jgi:hypothetical protein
MEEELVKDFIYLYRQYLIREALEELGDFQVRGKVIHTCNMHMAFC